MHKIAVLGTITKDTIFDPQETKRESFGGILYNVLAVSALGGKEVKVYPVCNLGYDLYQQVLKILKKHKNIDLAGIKKVRTRNNHNFLYYDKNNNREEISKNSVPRLTYPQIEPFIGSDVILVNFISGSDIHLKTLKKLGRNTQALIFMDIHSLIMGRRKDGKRFVKVPENWQEWIGCADILQCNHAELNALSNKKTDSFARVKSFARQILLSGPQVFLVTKGKESGYVFQVGKKGIKSNRTLVPRPGKIKDLTGCGDVFSAGFIISYLESKDPVLSAEFANSAASHKCRFSGVEILSKLSTYSP